MEVSSEPIWADLKSRYPRRPYVADNPEHGLLIRGHRTAFDYQHVQFNDPMEFRWIVADIDKPDAAERWDRANQPAPNIIVQNPRNGHAHLMYALRVPVTGEENNGRSRPLHYLAAIQRGLTVALSADASYRGLIAKNPLSPKWRTSYGAPFAYSLEDLARNLDPSDMRRPPRREVLSGVGRNCETFNEVRHLAYREVSAFKATVGSFECWFRYLEKHAAAVNCEFATPMSTAEVRGIAKSVAKWTWAGNFTGRQVAAFSRKQASRRAIGVEKRAAEICSEMRVVADMRRVGSASRVAQVIQKTTRTVRRRSAVDRESYLALSTEAARPWLAAGVSRATWYRRLAAARQASATSTGAAPLPGRWLLS